MPVAVNYRTLIDTLIGFDTVSRNSNLQLIHWVADYLDGFGVGCELFHDEEKNKANLFATIGPDDQQGVVLSGHTDVVPIDGQDWSSDPFTVVERDDRLFGRGTSDMKSFIAIILSHVAAMQAKPLKQPIHLALSFDEEIGCLGVRHLLKDLAVREIKPSWCIIGEPTSMGVIRAHKGKLSQRCHVHGLSGHSGLTHRAVNAVEAAAEAIAFLKSLARQFRDQGPFDREYDPPYTTVHTGVINGGTQLNIVPNHCHFDFEFRHLPEDQPAHIMAKLQSHIDQHILPEMHAVSQDTGFEFETLAQFAGLNTSDDHAVVEFTQELTGTTDTGKVSFGTEAGLFSEIGIPGVVCGPGSITQAHKPDEYIDIAQLVACDTFMQKFIARLQA